jgi:hypothetical protein
VIDTRARTAAATAAEIPMWTTRYDLDEQVEELAALTATWTGAGDLEVLRDRAVASGPGWHLLAATRGWQRPATATGTVDGVAIPGELGPDTVIVHVRQTDLSIYPPAPPSARR